MANLLPINQGNLSNGSSGDAVKQLQQMLKNLGYKINVDGIFGPATEAVVKQYQKDNGLTVDGIVGPKTIGSLNRGGTKQVDASDKPPAIPTLDPAPELGKYETGTWGETEEGKAAFDAYKNAKDAVNNYGDFNYGKQGTMDSIMKQIRNYGDFSYDVNSDALYQQYADQYTRQGLMAMQDTMGQAAAMTGGYGNSYASTVGNQAYQSYLQQLNDKVPELAQMAYNRWSDGRQDLYNQYGMYSDDRNFEFGKYQDGYKQVLDQYTIAGDAYYKGGEMFNSEQANKNTVIGQQNSEKLDIWKTNNTNKWNVWDADNTNWWNQKDYDLKDRQVKVQEGQLELQKKSINNTTPTINPATESDLKDFGTKNQGLLSTDAVKQLQRVLGVTVDGKFGPETQAAAGGLNAMQAFEKYVTRGEKPSGNNPSGNNNFTGNTIAEAQTYMTANGISRDDLTQKAIAMGLMDEMTWRLAKARGDQSLSVTKFSSYREYLDAITIAALKTYYN